MAHKQPNILVITGHDFGRHLGCYGHGSAVTPHLDEFARDAVVCDNAFAAAPLCAPSRAAMLTGLSPHSAGMLGFPDIGGGFQLRDTVAPLAKQLQANGYSTALAGVQHLAPAERVRALGYDLALTEPAPNARTPGPVVCEAVRDFLCSPQSVPFYLEVGFFEAHTDWSRFPGTGWQGEERSQGVEIPPYLPDVPEVEKYLAAFQYGVRQLDAYVGEILDALAASGHEENTWLIIAADHGLPITRAKATLYDAGLEVALMMRCPAMGIRGGRRIRSLISNIDVLATLLDGIGASASEPTEGQSFFPALNGQTFTAREAIFAELTFCNEYIPTRCVRTERFKLIYNVELCGYSITLDGDARLNPGAPAIQKRYMGHKPHFELYDLAADPYEQTNIYDVANGGPGVDKISLRNRLREWMQETADPVLGGPIASAFFVEGREQLLQS
jgi:N-sulfoglucosamine sulfohydrolase